MYTLKSFIKYALSIQLTTLVVESCVFLRRFSKTKKQILKTDVAL